MAETEPDTPLIAENVCKSEKQEQNKDEQIVPPDGGFWAWVVLASCFLVNGIIFGIINTFGILFVQLKKDMEEAGVEDAATKCALVGSLTIGTTFFLSFLVGMLADKIGLRLTAVIGGALATLGMALSAVGYKHIEVLYVTYGIMFGTGSSLVYTPSLTILGHYFRKKLGVVNGIVTAGSSLFTIGLSFINQYILENHGLLPCLQMFAGLSSLLILCALTFIPVLPNTIPPVREKKMSRLMVVAEKLVYLDNWRNKRFVVWAFAIPLALFGYFVPYCHLPQFAKDIPLDQDDLINGEKASKLIMCIGVSSGLGRVASGFIADLPAVKRNGNRIILQQISFFSIGICTMLLTTAQLFGDHVFLAMLSFCFILGIFDGCFITMLGPIAFDICGPAGAGQAIGFLLAMCSIPLTIGPTVAGAIYDKVGDYTGAFLGAGVPPIVGAVVMLTIRCFPPEDQDSKLSEKKAKYLPQSETKNSLVEKI
eukprot:TRINITY_DN6699_c0_g1_i1.p1 TRINITY_DN6699_c0_g1~~TRINITY_DN6699_c0_g1_i1.p1  ORF type:complete len:481 (-),score=83.59 TRINITY_DN6699_c0_g1_i1:68-1510(-)